MRLRNIPEASEKIKLSPWVVADPPQNFGAWDTEFANKAPIHLEIGMGKGQFIIAMAKLHPENNYVGIERFDSVLLRATQRCAAAAAKATTYHEQQATTPTPPAHDIQRQKIPNLRLLRFDATELTSAFAPGEVACVYLNFSDPWPKKRHAKRRLTSPPFLARYANILTADGELIFKTDNRKLFDYSLESIKEAGWSIESYTYDLHHEMTQIEENVMTEYETRFVALGKPICRLVARPPYSSAHFAAKADSRAKAARFS